MRRCDYLPLTKTRSRTANEALRAVFTTSLLALCGCQTSLAVRTPSQPALREVTVNMGSMYYSPDTIHALAGQPLMVTFVNDDTVNHDFIIDRGASGMIHMFVPKGRRIATSLFFEEPGTVDFICSQSGHQAAGMVGKIVVE